MEKGHSCCGCPRHTDASWWGVLPCPVREHLPSAKHSSIPPYGVSLKMPTLQWCVQDLQTGQSFWAQAINSTGPQGEAASGNSNGIGSEAVQQGPVCTMGSLRLQARGHSSLLSALQVNLNNQTPFTSMGKGQISPSTVKCIRQLSPDNTLHPSTWGLRKTARGK